MSGKSRLVINIDFILLIITAVLYKNNYSFILISLEYMGGYTDQFNKQLKNFFLLNRLIKGVFITTKKNKLNAGKLLTNKIWTW